jgi:hypothetical protein
MSIEKKSLISTLKSTKKANVVTALAPEASEKISKTSRQARVVRQSRVVRQARVVKS